MTEKELFDPKKNYKWEADQKITITGEVFGVVMGLLRKELSSPEAQEVFTKQGVYNYLMDVVRTEVNAGNFKEIEEETPKTVSDLEFEENQG